MAYLLGLTLGLILVGVSYSADSHCCINHKMTGSGLIVTATLQNGSSTPTMMQNSFTFDHDYDQKLQRVNGSSVVFTGTSPGGQVHSYQVIRDYNQKKSYNVGDAQCRVDPLNDVMQDGCVPQSLSLVGTFAFGSGSETAHINAWAGQIGDETWTMATTVNDCTIISFTRIGTQPDGSKITETAQFANIVQGKVSDPHGFVVPLSCKPGAAATGVGK